MTEPTIKRTIAFFDGMNLFNHAKDAYGHLWFKCDPIALAESVCLAKGWSLSQVRFYTGVPAPTDWRHRFWANKLAALGRRGAFTYTRRTKNGKEKGIDVRIALDMVVMAIRGEYDVALVFSQDQDLREAVEELRWVSRDQGRWIKVASAFPDGSSCPFGIGKTDWIPISRTQYEGCLDPVDHRR